MKLIVAVDKNWAIGKNNRMMWSIPADLKFFRETTKGNVVIMGRKTLESFPQGQPLEERVNIVLTRNPAYKVRGAVVAHSVKEALKEAGKYDREVFVIGGESIYRQFLPYCTTAHVTSIDYSYDGDAYFPDLEKEEGWYLAEEGDEQTYFDLCYTFRRFQRKEQ